MPRPGLSRWCRSPAASRSPAANDSAGHPHEFDGAGVVVLDQPVAALLGELRPALPRAGREHLVTGMQRDAPARPVHVAAPLAQREEVEAGVVAERGTMQLLAVERRA